MTTKPTECETDSHSERQARAQYESIAEMVDALLKARIEGQDEAVEAAEQAIQQDALAVNVRSDWHEVGATNAIPYDSCRRHDNREPAHSGQIQHRPARI